MPEMRLNVQSFTTLSIVLSVVSAALSLFFYVGDSKPFIILTSAAPLSMFAGFIATAAIAYELLKARTVSAGCLGAFALAVAANVFSEFIIRDYASNYSVFQ